MLTLQKSACDSAIGGEPTSRYLDRDKLQPHAQTRVASRCPTASADPSMGVAGHEYTRACPHARLDYVVHRRATGRRFAAACSCEFPRGRADMLAGGCPSMATGLIGQTSAERRWPQLYFQGAVVIMLRSTGARYTYPCCDCPWPGAGSGRSAHGRRRRRCLGGGGRSETPRRDLTANL